MVIIAHLLIALGFGLIVGSFLNVVILRTISGERLTGRSRCPACHAQLGIPDLVPVFSYLFLSGRCRHCKNPISFQYPIVEAATAIAFGLIVITVPHEGLWSIVLCAIYAVGVSLFLAIGVIDAKTTYIPDMLAYALAVVAFSSILIDINGFSLPTIADVIAGPAIALPLAGLWFFSKGQWLGLGDAKLALSIGWFLGLSGGITALMLSFWIGAAISLALLAVVHLRTINKTTLADTKTPITMKSEIPFAPFLIAGTAVVALTGFDLVMALS